ncbi:MAG TPA: glycosyltransferase family 87 protein [Anaerolineales bacterium]|nr:glycosyltransferase family 87 protein [Anaerolineales bacterium]
MAGKKIGRGLIVAGIIGITLSFLIAVLFTPNATSRSLQILIIEISGIVILFGIWLTRTEANLRTSPGEQTYNPVVQLMNVPIIVWVLLGFLLVYVLLFILPVFLNPGRQMIYLTGYIPNLNPIGNDLRVMVDLIKGWATGDQSPYSVQFYPPLTYIVFAPLLLIQDPSNLYRLFTLFTFVSYCLLTLLLPLKIVDKKYLSLVLLLFVTGLFSYGFQFELERGQYNVFTFLLCMTSIYIFHYHPKYRLLAYLLFSLSVQLKLYPAIFIVMFVDDWRDWKNIVLRFAGLGLFNLLLFFVMGFQTFWDFMSSVTTQVVNPSWIGVWNHSISSFVSMLKQDGFGLAGLESLRVLRRNEVWIEGSLILVFVLFFLFALVLFHLRRKTGLDPYLLLTCTIGALILPISYDYTLSILVVPVLLLLAAENETNNTAYRSFSILLILGISAVYFAILTPYNYRPYFLNNSFPLLFVLLILVTISNFVRYKSGTMQPATNG